MSTKAIESVLKWVLQGDAHSDAPAALKELEVIRKACVALDAESIGEYVYDVRDRELKGWDGPRVTAWGNASQVISAIAKESK